MDKFKIWLQSFLYKLRLGFSRFMQGRYGSDKLGRAMVWAGFGCYIASLLLPWALAQMGLILLSYGLILWSIFRMLSRNTYKRYQENRKYLRLLERVKDREHKHFDCPRCRQPVRVPKGKGKICITCPKCAEKFIRKS